MRRSFSHHLLILTVSTGLGLCWSTSWGQICPVQQGCSTSIVSGADSRVGSTGWAEAEDCAYGVSGQGRVAVDGGCLTVSIVGLLHEARGSPQSRLGCPHQLERFGGITHLQSNSACGE